MDVQVVKQLRDLTGAGFGDCKKALEATKGDLDAAVRHLKEMGLASASKRSGREANEARIFGVWGNKGVAFVILSCETDFVVRNETFAEFGKKLAKSIADSGATELNQEQKDELTNLGAIIKENIQLKNLLFVPVAANQSAYVYIHGEDGRKGSWAVAQVEGKDPKSPEVLEQVKEFALHAAARDPLYFSDKDVPESYLKEQREIFTVQAKNLGKPEAALQKIIDGKLEKHLSEIVFLKQPYASDGKMTVSQAISEVSRQLGCKFEIVSAGVITKGA
jgi:elongation factor Ts